MEERLSVERETQRERKRMREREKKRDKERERQIKKGNIVINIFLFRILFLSKNLLYSQSTFSKNKLLIHIMN